MTGQFVKEVAADWNAWGAWKRAPDGTLTSKRTCKNAPKGPCRGQDLRRKRKQPKVFRREGMYDVEVQTGTILMIIISVLVNVNATYIAYICVASEALFVNHLYSASSQIACGSAVWVSNTTHYYCCHY